MCGVLCFSCSVFAILTNMETFKFIQNVCTVLVALGVTFLLLGFVRERVEETPATPENMIPTEAVSVVSTKGVVIYLDQPAERAVITSPLTISGKAPGNWFFEASAPVSLEDQNGNVITESYMTAEGNWMTTDHVPFTGTITFTLSPGLSEGYLILRKDNPSGEPQFDDVAKIKILFQ